MSEQLDLRAGASLILQQLRARWRTLGTALFFALVWASSIEQEWEHTDERDYMSQLAKGRLLPLFDQRSVGGSQCEGEDVSLETQLTDLRAVIDASQLQQFDLIWYEGTASFRSSRGRSQKYHAI